ncbi:MAG: hypothetical protein D6748_09035 [Calditrichaeota bacterium]|nr:MAG: hypothetical protein D6748_09035 [Calditrichota bacterium]
MQKKFRELEIGQRFRLVGDPPPGFDKNTVFEKIRFMRNFYMTTGNKKNARALNSPSKLNDKFIFVEDDQRVEVV